MNVFRGLQRSHGGELVWRPPELLSGFESAVMLAQMIDDVIANGVPIAPSLGAFDQPRAKRPRAHNRSYYVPVPPKSANPSYIAIKGTEPLPVNQLTRLAESGLTQVWTDDGLPAIDVFPVLEYKVPMAVTVDEAWRDATVAYDICKRFADRYGELPCLPYPLAIVQ